MTAVARMPGGTGPAGRTRTLEAIERWAEPAAAAADRILRRLEAPPLLGLAFAAIALLVITYYAEPYGRLWGTGQDARSYWAPVLANPYANADWTTPAAYPYSPVFIQVLEPIRALPWQAFVAAWTLILLAGLRYLTGPRLFAAGVLVASMEIAGGNITILIGAAIVAGFRFAGTWALPILTKVTPGVGLLWFAVRREWKPLAVAAATTAVIVAVSVVMLPDAWRQWPGVLADISGRSGTWAAIPVPLVVRLPVAIAVVTWGAMTNRRWTVPAATMLALPALWYGSLTLLLAVIPLLDRDQSTSTAGEGAGAGFGAGRPGDAEPAPAA